MRARWLMLFVVSLFASVLSGQTLTHFDPPGENLEGDTGTTTIFAGVRLTPASGTEVRVDYRTFFDGAARPGIDYVETSGTLVFAPGETEKLIPIQVIGDQFSERDEFFVLRLENAVGATIELDADEDIVIVDDDPERRPEISTATARETDGTLTYTISTQARTEGPLTFSVEFEPGTATPGVDYIQPAPFLVTFQGENRSQTFSIPVIADNLVEGDETFVIVVRSTDLFEGFITRRTATIIDAASVNGADVPTLSEWMLIALAGLLALCAAMRLR
ncbi:MAG TPA: IPTL-CTERM sorting domain-containing protein [Thermoanaerobaculia bacterium]